MAQAPPGLLTTVDRSALTVWVIAEDIHRRASEELAKGSLLVESGGAHVPNRLIGILTRQALVLLKAASDLGFTPASRPRMAEGGFTGKALNARSNPAPAQAPEQAPARTRRKRAEGPASNIAEHLANSPARRIH
jgi:hypothetical protein